VNLFNGFGKWAKRFVPEAAYRENWAKQSAMTRMTVEQLRKHGMSDGALLKVEFFFYTNTVEKAAALAAALRELGYSVEHGPSVHDKRVFAVTGWTTKMWMDEGNVVDWARHMCDLGFQHDCEFDGWGTLVKPDE
jgi:regulator of RNase E activity RraB